MAETTTSSTRPAVNASGAQSEQAPKRWAALRRLLSERIVIFDGAMGTRIQAAELTDADFRGEPFRDHPADVYNLNDLLVLTRPDVIEGIHREYLDAGADIVETNTFNANAISLIDYQLVDRVYELNLEGARVARRATDGYERDHPGEVRFVAGSIGPTSRTCSMSQDVNDPAARGATFEDLRATYYEQARGLIDGGVDLLLPETTIDTLNLKAALFAIAQLKEERGLEIPVIASVTFIQAGSNRMLAGQTVEAFWASISNHDLLAVTINCSLGPKEMRAHVRDLAALAPIYSGCYPNAGLPNEMGGFDQTPEVMAEAIGAFAREGWLNLAGGCCGTTPEHVRAIAEAVRGAPPRVPPEPSGLTTLSGLEPFTIRPDSNLTLVGERTNVAGSRKFLRLIKRGEFEPAVEVARDQVQGGANVLDVNMDDGLIEGVPAMTRFLNQIAAEPDIAALPVMVDSSDWEILEAGLRCLQGKGVVNSLSLKDGEEEFLRRARLVRRYGAAVLVMGFDEEKQATTVEERVVIGERIYRLLTEEVGFPPEDVIYDPNVFPVATGIDEHDGYALAYIEATRELKRRCPKMKISGGISNVSFSFRGNDVLREAMHAVFLYHAIDAGLDLGIVNAGQLAVYEDIEPELREAVEDVILARRPDATPRLTALAERFQGKGSQRVEDLTWREQPVGERLAHALLHGIVQYVDDDVAEALEQYDEPLSIIEGPLMDGMGVVGQLFGAGKMFLPQVVKSARVMQKAVKLIEPHMPQKASGQRRGKVLLATVKGDVHDIGKNIVGVVLSCNGYEIVDLGVMVTSDRILAAAREHGVDMIGLSGLITPSLHEMALVAREMQEQGFDCPLLIGGATTSLRHTAVKIAPVYTAGPVVHVLDASRSVEVVGQLRDPKKLEELTARTASEQAAVRVSHAEGQAALELVPIEEARERRTPIEWRQDDLPTPAALGVFELQPELAELTGYIDWTPFFQAWELKGSYPSILDKPDVGPRARELKRDADALLDRIVRERWLEPKAVYGLFRAHTEGDDVVLQDEQQRELLRLPMLRQQQGKRTRDKAGAARPQQCLADLVAPKETGLVDHAGLFVVTSGAGAAAAVARFRAEQDEYNAILVQALADRLAEATAEWLHERVRAAWGYEPVGTHTVEDLIRERYRGIRPAPGYPACPDHLLKPRLFELLGATERTGVTLTDGMAMDPASSVCGMLFAHPQARYFGVGKVGRDQVEDYARRLGVAVSEVERSIPMNLAYDPA